MRTSAYMGFRGDAEAVRVAMPAALSRVAGALRDPQVRRSDPRDVTSTAEVELLPAELEAVLAWGRTPRPDGRTWLKSALVEDWYERALLDTESLVELVRPLRVECPPVRNLPAAHLLEWTCSRCDRVRVAQTAPLDVDFEEAADAVEGFPGHPDLVFTPQRHLLVSSRFSLQLGRFGVQTRALANATSHLQVLPSASLELDASRAPLERAEVCPGCGVTTLYRNSVLEGDPPMTDTTGLSVIRDRPLSLARLASDPPPASTSLQEIDPLIDIHPGPVHRPGARVPPERTEELLRKRGWNVPFVSAALLGALWDAGATGIEFRPVFDGSRGRRKEA